MSLSSSRRQPLAELGSPIWIGLRATALASAVGAVVEDKGAGTGSAIGTLHMGIHKKILEWQAAHPNITWIGWGVVWLIVLAILFWPRRSG